jgi:hypothetical protein
VYLARVTDACGCERGAAVVGGGIQGCSWVSPQRGFVPGELGKGGGGSVRFSRGGGRGQIVERETDVFDIARGYGAWVADICDDLLGDGNGKAGSVGGVGVIGDCEGCFYDSKVDYVEAP